MLWRTLRRVATSTKVLVVAAILFTVGVVGGTTANFTAEDDSTTATAAGGWVDSPASPTLVASGYDGDLAWTPGANGVLAQTILSADRNANASCNNNYATTVSTTEPGAESTYTDAGVASASAANGDYFCYSIQSTWDSWTSATTTVGPVQLGFVPLSISTSDGGTSGDIDNGDTITIAFNQPITLSEGTIPVEACSSAGTIRVGDTNCSGAVDFATISGLTVGANTAFGSSTISVQSGTNLKIVLAGGGSTTISGTATFKATASETIVESSAGAASACTAANTCRPTAAVAF